MYYSLVPHDAINHQQIEAFWLISGSTTIKSDCLTLHWGTIFIKVLQPNSLRCLQLFPTIQNITLLFRWRQQLYEVLYVLPEERSAFTHYALMLINFEILQVPKIYLVMHHASPRNLGSSTHITISEAEVIVNGPGGSNSTRGNHWLIELSMALSSNYCLRSKLVSDSTHARTSFALKGMKRRYFCNL